MLDVRLPVATFLWADQSADTIKQSLMAYKHRVRTDYVRRVTMQDDLYHGDHQSWMEGGGVLHPDDELSSSSASTEAYLQRFFPNAWDNGKGSLLPQYLPLLKRTVDTVAGLFHRKPELTLDTADNEPVPTEHPQMEIWRDIQRQTQLAQTLKELQHKTFLHKTMLAHVRWSFGRLRVDPIHLADGFIWEAEEDPADLRLAPLVMHELPAPMKTPPTTTERRWAVWQQDAASGLWSFAIRNLAGKVLPNRLFPKGVNAYGTYPYILCHDGQPRTSAYAELDDSLLSAQIGLDLLWTDFHLACRMNGGVVAMHTDQGTKLPRALPFGRDRAMVMGLEEKVETIQLHQSLPDMLEFARDYIKTFAVLHGLHPDSFAIEGQAFAQAITAVAKQVDRLDVQETREDYETYWEGKLADLFDLIRLVWNVWNPARQLDPRLRLRIKWIEPREVVSPLEAAQASMARLNGGLSYPVREIMRLDGVDEAEAARVYGRWQEWNKERTQRGDPGIRQTPDGSPEGFPGGE